MIHRPDSSDCATCALDRCECEELLRHLSAYRQAEFDQPAAGASWRGRVVGVSPRRGIFTVKRSDARLCTVAYADVAEVRTGESSGPGLKVRLLEFLDSASQTLFRIRVPLAG